METVATYITRPEQHYEKQAPAGRHVYRKTLMNAVKIIRTEHDVNQRIAIVAKRCFVSRLILVVTVVFSLTYVESTPAQKILKQTGFEDQAVGKKEDAFQASIDTVKTGKKSLTIFFDGQGRLLMLPYKLETEKPIVSVEFWVYIERGKQSFAISIHSAEEVFDNDAGGPYIDWQAGITRCHVHHGDPWRKIGDFPVNKWHYVRIVSNFEKSLFDFYTGDSREVALASQPKKNLPFQNAALAPRAKWFIFFAWAMTARGYVDDLLIYEGEEPLNLAVNPTKKLARFWGQLKRQ